jgi:hypothetical protein
MFLYLFQDWPDYCAQASELVNDYGVQSFFRPELFSNQSLHFLLVERLPIVHWSKTEMHHHWTVWSLTGRPLLEA